MEEGSNKIESPLQIVRLEPPGMKGPGDFRTFSSKVSGLDLPLALVTVRMALFLPGELKTTFGFF